MADASAHVPKRTLVSIGWVYAALVLEKLSTFVTTAVLARFLVPEEFGLIATALLIIGIIAIFRDLGIVDSVIYFDDQPDETNDSSFVIHVALGAAQTIILFISAPLIAHVIGQGEDLVAVLRAMSPVLFFMSLGLTHTALLQKRLLFARRALIDVLTATLKAIITIYLAWLGWKVWALVAGFIFSSVFRTVALWVAVSWRPGLKFARDRMMEMLHYGKHIFGEGLVHSLLLYADQIAILLLFGSKPLAYYFIAARIPELILHQIAVVLTAVMFPTISNMKADLTSVRTFVVQATRLLSYIAFPVALGLVVIAVPLLELAFGVTWIVAAPYLVVVSLRELLIIKFWVVGDGLKAIGRPDVIWRISVIEMILSVILIGVFMSIYKSPIVACLGVPAAMLIGNILRLKAAKDLLGIEPSAFVRALAPATAAALIMFGCVYALDLWIAAESPLVRVAIDALAGAAVYALALWLIDGRQIRDDIARLTAPSPSPLPQSAGALD